MKAYCWETAKNVNADCACLAADTSVATGLSETNKPWWFFSTQYIVLEPIIIHVDLVICKR